MFVLREEIGVARRALPSLGPQLLPSEVRLLCTHAKITTAGWTLNEKMAVFSCAHIAAAPAAPAAALSSSFVTERQYEVYLVLFKLEHRRVGLDAGQFNTLVSSLLTNARTRVTRPVRGTD